MTEESVTVMLLPDDDTETILEKVRRAGVKKVNLIVPPGNRALQTLGGFTMLRKACDITGIEVTVYSDDERARDMAQVCRFEVVSLDQEVRPREAPPEEPRIVVSTRPPEPSRAEVAPAAAEGRPPELQERLADLSDEDLALFDALEGMSLTEDVELRPEAFARPARAVEERPVERLAPVRREEPAPERPPRKPSPFRRILEPLASVLANIYIAVLSLFLKVASRFAQREEAVAEEAPAAAVAPRVRTDEEQRALRMVKVRYYLWTLLGVAAVTALLVGIYLLSQPGVTVSLVPKAAETREMDLSLSVALTDALDPQGQAGPIIEGGMVTIQAQMVEVELDGEAAVQATGKTWVPESTATGAVIFTNPYSEYGFTVPAGTVVSGGGATFHTTQEVWLPGSDFVGSDAYVGIAQVNVVADTPGSAGNVGVGVIATVEGSLAGQVRVIKEIDTSGGAEREVTMVTAEDHDRLREELVVGLQEEAYAELQRKLGGMEVLSGTLEVETVEESFSHAVGEEAETVTLVAKVWAYALVSAPGALNEAVEQAVYQEIGEPKSGQEVGTITTGALEEGRPGVGTNTWTYDIHVSVPILNAIDDALKAEIGGRLAGKSFAEAHEVMAEYVDRIDDYYISPAVDPLPGAGIRVVDVGTEP